MQNEDAERVISDGSGRKSTPDDVFISPRERNALLSSLEIAEDRIKNDSGRETAVLFDKEGKGVFVKRANGTRVDIEKEVIIAGDRATGATFTHNHPRNASFSYADVETCCWGNFGELRAVSRLYKYSIRARKGNLSSEIFESVKPLYTEIAAGLRSEMGEPNHDADLDEYDREFTHRLWERLAPQAGLTYNREKQRAK